MCPDSKCKCQKQSTLTPNQFQLEGAGFNNRIEKKFEGSEKAWNSFPKPAVNTLAPFIGMARGAKNKSPEVGQATTNILRTISGGKILSLTDLLGNGLRLKVMYFISNLS